MFFSPIADGRVSRIWKITAKVNYSRMSGLRPNLFFKIKPKPGALIRYTALNNQKVMFPIIYREINSFFASAIGYLVVAVFLVVNGLFLWIFKGPYNILDNGFADLSPFFDLAPWVLLFLVPAVSMKSFSDEMRMGTLELLLTRPLSLNQIVLGKYFGAILLIFIALVPTALYIYTVDRLGNPPGNWDSGSTLGSYLGLFFLILTYTAIGIFSSTLTQNQIAAFLIGVFLCLILFYGPEGISTSSMDISGLGLKAHFDSISRGVLDTRDLLYFMAVSILFLGITVLNLKKR